MYLLTLNKAIWPLPGSLEQWFPQMGCVSESRRRHIITRFLGSHSQDIWILGSGVELRHLNF